LKTREFSKINSKYLVTRLPKKDIDITVIHAYYIVMYIRTTTRKNKDGTVAQYVQLAHNEWLPEAGRSNTKVLYNFGRREDVDIQGLERLVGSIQRFIGAETPSAGNVYGADLVIESTKALGGSWFLNQYWERLEINECLKRLLKARGYEIPIERAIFAMVANRALNPSSKLSCENWVRHEAWIPSLESISIHQLYRSMDFLVENHEEIQKELFFSVATVINLEVDLLYFDTTSTYFEIEEPDDIETDEDSKPEDGGEGKNKDKGGNGDQSSTKTGGLRKFGHGKDHRDDLPQVIIGLAVTRDGIPIRCWVFDGNTADVEIVGHVKKDLAGWRLNRVISVMDRGFASDDNCIKLQNGGGHYILGEKMRTGKPEAEAALSKKGRYTGIGDDLYAKETTVGDGECRKRYVIAYNPREAKKDQLTRERHLADLKEKIGQLRDMKEKDRTKAVSEIVTHRVYSRYVKILQNGQVKIDNTAVAAEKRLDGKYLIKTSDDTLSIADIVLGYKQLKVIEDDFRTLKTDLELRPVYHRKPDRIKSHVLLCFFALLLIRVAENETGQRWFYIERELRKLNLVTLKTPTSTVRQSTEPMAYHKAIFKKCRLEMPPRVFSIEGKP